jgi:hypothetical protein
VTDAKGHVRYGNGGLWPVECRVVVAKSGCRTQSFGVGELCSAREGTDDCHFLAFVADLVPVP